MVVWLLVVWGLLVVSGFVSNRNAQDVMPGCKLQKIPPTVPNYQDHSNQSGFVLHSHAGWPVDGAPAASSAASAPPRASRTSISGGISTS